MSETDVFQLFLAAAMILTASCQAQTTNYETEIKKALLKDRPYDRTSRPYSISGTYAQSVTTSVLLMLRSFQIDEHQLTASINAWTVMVWHDPRLTWQPSDYGNTHVVLMTSAQVWLPDIVLINGASHLWPTYMHSSVAVMSSGHAGWVTPSSFRVPCLKEMSRWPYDKQNCTAILSSWSLAKDLHEEPVHPDGPLVHSDDMVKSDSHWQMTSVKGYLKNATYSCCPGSVFHELIVELHVERVSLLYAMSYILPCIALAIHVLAVFWIPPESSAKITAAAIHSVALMLFLLNLFWWMPPVGGRSVPKIVSFVAGSLIMSVISGVTAVLVANLVTRSQSPPGPVLAVFTGIAGTVLRLGDLAEKLRSLRAPFAEDGAPVQDKEATARVRQAEWRLVAAGLDRLIWLIQLAVFVFLSLACLT